MRVGRRRRNNTIRAIAVGMAYAKEGQAVWQKSSAVMAAIINFGEPTDCSTTKALDLAA